MCLFPIRASYPPKPEGGRHFTYKGRGKLIFNPDGDILLPCQKCILCLKKRASEWALRAQHEISLHKENCFITLTYDEYHLPTRENMKKAFKQFMDSLRKKIHPRKIGYIVSHEYGEKKKRIHHHVLIFGYQPTDMVYLKTTPKGNKLFTAKEIKSIWKHGFHNIGDANGKTAYYIASYALKSKTHTITERQTGEIVEVSDKFDCSKRPGIGLRYLEKNYKQLIQSKTHLPRYYKKKLEDIDPEMLQQYEDNQKLSDPTTAQQKYDKLVCNLSKNNIIQNELRSNNLDESNKLRLQLLKKERDNFLQGEKTCKTKSMRSMTPKHELT